MEAGVASLLGGAGFDGKESDGVFTRLAVVKVSLWLASYQHVPPPS
jgi:hypothetical protein